MKSYRLQITEVVELSSQTDGGVQDGGHRGGLLRLGATAGGPQHLHTACIQPEIEGNKYQFMSIIFIFLHNFPFYQKLGW